MHTLPEGDRLLAQAYLNYFSPQRILSFWQGLERLRRGSDISKDWTLAQEPRVGTGDLAQLWRK
jgi:hypothetical protein